MVLDFWWRRQEPEAGEVREFLRRAAAGRDCDSPSGHADLAKLALAAEIGGAQEGDPGLGLAPVLVSGLGLAHPKARHWRRVHGQLRRDVPGWNREIAGIEEDFAGNVLPAALLHRVHAHGLGEISPHMHEGDRIDARFAVAEQRVFRLVVELAVGVVIDGGDDLGVWPRRRNICRARERLCLRL